MATITRCWREALWALPAVALIVAQVRPVLSRFDRSVLATLDGVDALMQSGIITWTARHVWQPAGWLDLPIFFPTRSALVFMDTLLGQALLVAPLELVADPPPALLYNLACVVTLVLVTMAGAALWLAGSEGDSRGERAAGAGLCALFLLGSPFTTWQLGMLNQISPPWPVFLLAAVWLGWRRFRTGGGGGRWWWAAAACLVLQAAWGWYGFADAVFVLGTVGMFGLWRTVRSRQLLRLLRQTALPAVAAGVVVLAIAWPYLAHKAAEPEYTRNIDEVQFYSADLNSLGNLGPHHATWGDYLGGGESASERALRNDGKVMHPGWLGLICVLVAAGRWRRLTTEQRRFGLLLGAVAAVGVIMAFGDSISIPPGKDTVRIPLPFGILQDIAVPFRAYRAPVRFVYLATIGVAWWATVGVTGLVGSWQGRPRRWLMIGALLAIWLESVPMGLIAVPVEVDGRPGSYPLPEDTPNGAILTLPAPPTEQEEDATETRWLHRALATGRPVTGGVSGWVPPVIREMRASLAACEAGDADPLAVLAELRALGVVGVEMSVSASDPGRVAFWAEVLTEAGYQGVDTAPGYRFYRLTP